jgi:urea-proton symporter
MNLLSPTDITVLMVLFGLTMLTVVWLRTHKESHADGFLVADRVVPVWQGALSIAVSWIWAPAIFVCSMQSFNNGMAGIFWFTAPNILCFFVFTPLAMRLRSLVPFGYTFPDFIYRRFQGNKAVHIAFLTVFLGYQLGAIVINTLAGGGLLHAVSGIDVRVAIVSMALIALSYSLLSGLKASIFTDVIQMIMVLGITFVLVPWCLSSAGGWSTVVSGLGGIHSAHANLFDPWIAFSMGIPMTLGLISGPIGDQMFFQRAMAVRKNDIAKTFICGGLLFGIVPIMLSLLGFIAAALVTKGSLAVPDAQVVGATVVAGLLPKAAVYAFILMAFAGLCSTLDSSMCAISSLGSIDIYKKYVNAKAEDGQLLRAARIYMLAVTAIGTAIALSQPKLLWVFLVYGALASAGLFPTIFALYSRRISAKAAAIAVMASLIIGTPLSIYANASENPYLIVTAAILSIAIGLTICTLSVWFNKEPQFDFASMLNDQSDRPLSDEHTNSPTRTRHTNAIEQPV